MHQGHLGVDKCLERAKQSMFWPGMSADIKETVARCILCQRFANNQQREPLIPHEIPDLPWNKVGMDILEFRSKTFLVVVDFYSHFPELRLLKQKRSEDVITALKSMFAVHGVPASIMADNMPFNSAQMNEFAKDWNFQIITSSPHYPKSNGMAERFVQTIKQFLKKADQEGDLYSALLAYRQTPIAGLLYSPAELLFNRYIRGPLPLSTRRLVPHVPEALPFLKERQNKQKEVHDDHCKALTPLTEGDHILMRTDKDSEWRPGRISKVHEQPRSYIIDTPNGAKVRRNRVHLKPNNTSSNAPQELPSEPELPPNGASRNRPNHTSSNTPQELPNEPELPPEVLLTDEETSSGTRLLQPTASPLVIPRRSTRSNRGTLPSHFTGFYMS
jgi:hypothetical protein